MMRGTLDVRTSVASISLTRRLFERETSTLHLLDCVTHICRAAWRRCSAGRPTERGARGVGGLARSRQQCAGACHLSAGALLLRGAQLRYAERRLAGGLAGASPSPKFLVLAPKVLT